MKYFTNIKTLDELKAAYRRLTLKYHPDQGGSWEREVMMWTKWPTAAYTLAKA